MSKKANPTIIGVFVLIGLLIAVTAIFILGSGSLFKESTRYVLYFDGNLSGLDIGAPIQYNGIPIGTVTDIRMTYDTDTGHVMIPVYVEIDPKRIHYTGSHEKGKGLEYHVKYGLRAQLQTQSFITGKLKIMMVLQPESPIKLVGADPETTEIPTVPTLIESLSEKIKNYPIEEMLENLRIAAETLGEIATSGDVQDLLSELKKTASALSTMATSEKTTQTVQTLTETLSEIKQLIAELNDSTDPVKEDLHRMMDEFADAAQAARNLMDYLERHPESLIYGKGE